ncbi:hypothetical protein ACHHYP_09281 [Achlya hypogyna]|uniref:Transmembrane protein n=1 Tax=Achlya hypogyna TaxID=1202772 RepID=A0A1V9ZJ98_ACHHY|nr:hypothetical protein ACHHYP_09281 [Achlya hypogyna]
MSSPKASGVAAIAFSAAALVLSTIAVALPRWASSATYTDGLGALCLTTESHRCLQYHTTNHGQPLSTSLCDAPAALPAWEELAAHMQLTPTQLSDHVNAMCSLRGNGMIVMVALTMFTGFVSLVVLSNGVCFGRLKNSTVPLAVVCNAVAFLAALISISIYSKPAGASYDVSWYLLLVAAFLYVVSLMFAIVYRTKRRTDEDAHPHTPFDDVLEVGRVRIETPTVTAAPA